MIRGGILSIFLLILASTLCHAAKCYGVVGLVASAVSGFPEAQSFCSSKFPIPKATVTAAAVTVTSTASTETLTSTSTTVTTVTSATSVSTVTSTVSISTSTSTVTTTSVSTSTETDTVTSMTTSYTLKQKRAVSTTTQPPSTTPATTRSSTSTSSTNVRSSSTTSSNNSKASILNGLFLAAEAVAGSICTCIETPRTTTTTSTITSLATATSTVTSTSTSTSFVTATSTFISSVTSTTTTTVTSTSTQISFTKTTTTVTNTIMVSKPQCSLSNTGRLGVGGCSSNCICDGDTDGVRAYCTTTGKCTMQCAMDSDCKSNEFCTNNPDVKKACGHSICESFDNCISSANLKRSVKNVFGGGEYAVPAKFERLAGIRAKWVEKRYVPLPNCTHRLGISCDG